MLVKALQNNVINGVSGRWTEINGINVFVDRDNKVVIPSDLKGQSLENIDTTELVSPQVNPIKIQLVTALIAANTARYPRLQEYLDNLSRIVSQGSEFQAEQEQLDNLITFINSYIPIDSKMQDFLKQYKQNTTDTLQQLTTLIAQDAQTNVKPKSIAPTIKKENPINVRKFGLYRFPFLQQEKLYLGDIEKYKTIPQVWNYTGTHWKLWKDINRLPFLVNGYPDDEYSAVNRVLASQAAKLLGLQCEEVFLGYLHNKCVTLSAFHEAVTLLENQAFEFYKLADNYYYLSDQKASFYFLIQHWVAYANTPKGVKARFDAHYIDNNGEVFLSNHQQAMFLTPQLMARNLRVKLDITPLNYQPIKDMVRRVGGKDFADIVFSSIPVEFVELHDEIATKLNKTTFEKKKECFDGNWVALLDALAQFEAMPRVM